MISGLLFMASCSSKNSNDSSQQKAPSTSSTEKVGEETVKDLTKKDQDKELIKRKLKGRKYSGEEGKTLDEQIEESEDFVEEEF